MVDHYELNIAANGKHYARVHLPAGLTEAQAKARAKVFAKSLDTTEIFEVTMYAVTMVVRHEIEL